MNVEKTGTIRSVCGSLFGYLLLWYNVFIRQWFKIALSFPCPGVFILCVLSYGWSV